jgi:predicted  nucleic acid-binding Zn-ribbon protein
MDRNTGNRPANHGSEKRLIQRWLYAAVVQNQSNKEKDQVQLSELIQRKQDIKSRLSALRTELRPHEQAVENLRERLRDLEDDWKDVLDKIQEEEKKARKTK